MYLLRIGIYIFICIFLMSSCYRILLGLKPSKIETYESVVKSSLKFGIDTSILYIYDRDTMYSNIDPSQVRYNTMFLFNANNTMLRNPVKCATGLYDLMLGLDDKLIDSLLGLKPDKDQKHSFERMINSNLLNYNKSREEKFDLNDNTYEADFYLFYYWTKALPRITKRDLDLISKMLEDERYRLKVFYINVDLMDFWYEDKTLVGSKIRLKPVFVK